jgi:uracil-DNA glycosylase family 4
VLYEAGYASQPTSVKRGDGLELTDAWITAAVRCAPPDNKPAREEIASCAPYLDEEVAALKQLRVVVALGKIAFDSYCAHVRRMGRHSGRMVFAHGVEYPLSDGRILLGTYHPSLQNTNTGRLTKAMFLDIFRRARLLSER